MRDLLLFLYDFFIPHFLTEDVALIEVEPGIVETAFPASMIQADDDIAGVICVTSFVWLGVAWFPRADGPVRPYVRHPDASE